MVAVLDRDVVEHSVASDDKVPGARPGREYRDDGRGHVVRIAKVIDVRPDTQGIPHVRFEVRVGCGHDRSADYEESRILTLETFVSQFREAIDG